MKKIVLILAFIFFLVPVLSALTIDIGVNSSFFLDDQIFFRYDIISDITQNITFISHVSCPNAPVELLQEKTESLTANVPYRDTYGDFIIHEDIESQICTAYIQILEPFQQLTSKNFSIITPSSFSFEIKVDKKVFVQNEEINMDYQSAVENPSIKSTLTFPDSTIQQLSLPTSVLASQIGTYELEITASKEGYKTIIKKEQFGVIEGSANIPYTGPQVASSIKSSGKGWIILLGILIVVAGIISYIIYRKRKSSSDIDVN